MQFPFDFYSKSKSTFLKFHIRDNMQKNELSRPKELAVGGKLDRKFGWGPILMAEFCGRIIFITVFENHRKSLIQHCERSELRLHFWVAKSSLKMPKMVHLASFWKPEDCGQTVLPDMSLLIGQKLVENAKNSNVTFWALFKQFEMVRWRLEMKKTPQDFVWVQD